MPRPKKDGTAASAAHRRNLTELLVRRLRPELTAFNVWDIKERGLVLRVQPSGHRAFKFVYSHRSSARWYHIGAIHLADARRIAAGIMLKVATGEDPVSERKAERSGGHIRAELATQYSTSTPRRRTKAGSKQDSEVCRTYLLPRWGSLQATGIARADAKALIAAHRRAVGRQSGIEDRVGDLRGAGIREKISGVTVDGFARVERNEVRSRERVPVRR